MIWPMELTIDDAARITGLTVKTVKRWRSADSIPAKWAKPIEAHLNQLKAIEPVKKPALGGWVNVAISLLLVLSISASALFTFKSKFRPSSDEQLAREAISNYRSLVKTEVIAKLRAANDGDLKSLEVKKIIQDSIPVIQKHTWSPLTDRLSGLQSDGLMKKEELDAALNAVERGL